MQRFRGCYTASITPLNERREIDYVGLRSLIEFQNREGSKGILAVGTTGESPTLNWEEHLEIIRKTYEYSSHDSLTIGGTGSNNTEESIEATREVTDHGVECVLLVEPYYNGPSSLEIRKEYIEPVAEQFPEVSVIPYVIPGRSGTQLLPQDLAVLSSKFENVGAVKEATGNTENMRLTRKLCGDSFDILSGDDDRTYPMMVDSEIRASGVISVVSNVAPRAVQNFIETTIERKTRESQKIYNALKPLFGIVTIKTEEETPFGTVMCKARNPLPYKTLMNILGMPSGPCRRPLGRLTKKALNIVLNVTRSVYEKTPEILEPVESFFEIDLGERLYKKKYWRGLSYA